MGSSLIDAIMDAAYGLAKIREEPRSLELTAEARNLYLREVADLATPSALTLPRAEVGQRNALWGASFGFVFVDLLDYKALLPAPLASLAEGDEGQQQVACDLIVPFVPQPPGSKRSGTWLMWREERVWAGGRRSVVDFLNERAGDETTTVLRRESRAGHWWRQPPTGER